MYSPKPFLAQRQHLLGRVGDLEQRAGRLVDADVRRLGRQHHRDQQGVGVDVFQFGLGSRVVGGKTAKEFVDIGGLHGRTLSRPEVLRKGGGIFTRGREPSYRSVMTAIMPNDTSGPGSGQRVFFDAILHPHRSLSPRGFAIFMGIFSAISLTVGGFFCLQGAWPIFGFFGLDILLVWYAFRRNYRNARMYETVRLTERELVVRRVGLRGGTAPGPSSRIGFA